MKKTLFYIDPAESNYLEVEFETSRDWSAGAGDELVIDICGVSLNGEMSIRIESLPADWKHGIYEKIRQKETAWETQ